MNTERLKYIFKNMTLFERCPQYRADAAFETVKLAYEGRPYHNFDHIEEFVYRILDMDIYKNYRSTLLTAAFFHDVVYEPLASNNEEESLYFLFHEAGAIDSKTCTELAALILSTKTHTPYAVPYNKEFLDFDMLPFQYDESSYDKYKVAIATEYKGAGVNAETFTCGRLKFLLGLYDRGQLYYTLGQGCEDRAWKNIGREIKELSSYRKEQGFEC